MNVNPSTPEILMMEILLGENPLEQFTLLLHSHSFDFG
jgi:hypothetical protein